MAVLEKTEEKYLKEIDELVIAAEHLLTTKDGDGYVDTIQFSKWFVSCRTLIGSLPISPNEYLISFPDNVRVSRINPVHKGIGILQALKDYIQKGFLQKGIELAKAEVFTDFLDIADHLLEHSYKDPAASLVGAVLEIELRNLCSRNAINVKDTDDISCLNGKLKDKEIYHQPMRSQIEAWKKIRDKADHGHFSEYTIDQVKDFLSGVRQFIREYLG